MKQFTITMAIYSVYLIVAVSATGQTHEPREWVDVYNEYGSTARLINQGGGASYAGTLFNSAGQQTSTTVSLTVQIDVGEAEPYRFDITSSTGYSGSGLSATDHMVEALNDYSSHGTVNWYTIEEWGDPLEEDDDDIQPREWVQVRVGFNSSDPSGNGRWPDIDGEYTIKPGKKTLKWNPASNQQRYTDLETGLVPGNWLFVEYTEQGSNIYTFTAGIENLGSASANGWTATQDGAIPGGQFITHILDWGKPYIDEDGDGQPDNPDPPPPDDPDSDGDGVNDSEDDDDDNNGVPDDEEPEPSNLPDTGIDCIDEWLEESIDSNFGDLVSSIRNGSEGVENFTIQINQPWVASVNQGITISTRPDTSTAMGLAIDTGRIVLLNIFKAAIVIYFVNKVILALRQF